MDIQPILSEAVYEGSRAQSIGSSERVASAQEVIRRSIDIVVSAVGFVVGIPIMLLLAVLIRLDSSGPAVFWQVRIGKNRRSSSHDNSYQGLDRRHRNHGGKPFWFVKFRTMYVDARKRFPDLYKYDYKHEEIPQLRFKLENDPRHTRIGRWLRKTSLDELPNFWNVLTGEMTLVGPRPDIPEMVQYYRLEQMRIFDVKPGLTGYAQICGRCSLKFMTTKSLDLQYVRERSLWMDMKVLARTVFCVLSAKGAF